MSEMDGERPQRARAFGQVAERYERWRPGYPDALYVEVLHLGHGRRILEVGAGTGRATLALAQRGASVLAIEPDPAMAAIARRRTQGTAVDVQESTFENCLVTPGAFDLVVAAQSWHWVDPVRGPVVAARALRPGGALCVWFNRPRELAGAVWDAIGDAYAQHAPALDRRAALREQPQKEQQFPAAPGFTPWTLRTFDWSATYNADSYTGLVQTHSDHLQLPPPHRERLIDAIRTAIDAGNHVEYRYRTVLATAQAQQH